MNEVLVWFKFTWVVLYNFIFGRGETDCGQVENEGRLQRRKLGVQAILKSPIKSLEVGQCRGGGQIIGLVRGRNCSV